MYKNNGKCQYQIRQKIFSKNPKGMTKNFPAHFFGCILNPGHGKIPAPDFNFYIQKDKYPI